MIMSSGPILLIASESGTARSTNRTIFGGSPFGMGRRMGHLPPGAPPPGHHRPIFGPHIAGPGSQARHDGVAAAYAGGWTAAPALEAAHRHRSPHHF